MGKRYQVGFPPFHEKRLLLWAYCKGASKTALTQNIVQARVEANEEQIWRMVDDIASEWGVTREEATSRILSEMGYTGDDEPEAE